MTPAEQTILLIGPGAIGAFIAARLSAQGHRVTVACRTSRTADEIAARGVVAESHDGERAVGDVSALVTPEELTDEPTLVVLATKCGDAAQALATWMPHIGREVPVVALQNGIMVETLAPLAAGRFIDGVVDFPATLVAPGHSQQTGPGGFLLGAWTTEEGATATPAHLKTVARVLQEVAPTDTTDNIRGAKWTKLIINSCISSLGVVAGASLGDLLKDRRARKAFLRINTEGEAVGRADGVTFERVQRFHPARLATPPGTWRLKEVILHQILKGLAARHRRHRSSSLQSLERGGRTEVDFLNGVIVRTGRIHGIGTPVNAAVVDLIHDIESGHAAPGMDRLDRLVR